MLELVPHDRGTADAAPDRPLVEDDPCLKRRVLVEEPLPLHAQVHHPADLFLGVPGPQFTQHRQGVFGRLQQAVDHVRLVAAQPGGLRLQAHVDVESRGQDVVVDRPPALAVTLAGHVDEHLARARVLDLIHLEHGGQVRRLGRRLARLDAGERRRGQAQLLGYFLELERMGLAQAPELGTEPAPADGGTKRHVKLASS